MQQQPYIPGIPYRPDRQELTPETVRAALRDVFDEKEVVTFLHMVTGYKALLATDWQPAFDHIGGKIERIIFVYPMATMSRLADPRKGAPGDCLDRLIDRGCIVNGDAERELVTVAYSLADVRRMMAVWRDGDDALPADGFSVAVIGNVTDGRMIAGTVEAL